jgi:hypothetical protein
MPVATVNRVGRGTAVLMNLYRDAGTKESLNRETFIRHLVAAGDNP